MSESRLSRGEAPGRKNASLSPLTNQADDSVADIIHNPARSPTAAILSLVAEVGMGTLACKLSTEGNGPPVTALEFRPTKLVAMPPGRATIGEHQWTEELREACSKASLVST